MEGVPAPLPPAAAGASAVKAEDIVKPWHDTPITGAMLKAAMLLLAGRATAADTTKKIMEDFERLMDSGDPTLAAEMLKPEKRARGRPRLRPLDEDRKHRDLGSYNLFVMKAQNVAGSDVKNHRAFMGLIGSFWKGMDQATRDGFNQTYRGLLMQLNEKKKAHIKFDFGNELKLYERDHELDTIGFFRGFMQQVKALPPPESKETREQKVFKAENGGSARLNLTAAGAHGAAARLHLNPAIPAPVEDQVADDAAGHDHVDVPGFDDLDDLDDHSTKKRQRKLHGE